MASRISRSVIFWPPILASVVLSRPMPRLPVPKFLRSASAKDEDGDEDARHDDGAELDFDARRTKEDIDPVQLEVGGFR